MRNKHFSSWRNSNVGGSKLAQSQLVVAMMARLLLAHSALLLVSLTLTTLPIKWNKLLCREAIFHLRSWCLGCWLELSPCKTLSLVQRQNLPRDCFMVLLMLGPFMVWSDVSLSIIEQGGALLLRYYINLHAQDIDNWIPRAVQKDFPQFTAYLKKTVHCQPKKYECWSTGKGTQDPWLKDLPWIWLLTSLQGLAWQTQCNQFEFDDRQKMYFLS